LIQMSGEPSLSFIGEKQAGCNLKGIRGTVKPIDVLCVGENARGIPLRGLEASPKTSENVGRQRASWRRGRNHDFGKNAQREAEGDQRNHWDRGGSANEIRGGITLG